MALRETIKVDPALLTGWFMEPTGALHVGATEDIAIIWLHDAALAENLLQLLWVADGIDRSEAVAIQVVAYLAVTKPELAGRLGTIPWASDGITAAEAEILETLKDWSFWAPEAALHLMSLPSFSTGLADAEIEVMRTLRALSSSNPSAVQEVLQLAWISDSITPPEAESLGQLATIPAFQDPDWSNRVTKYAWFDDGVNHLELKTLTAIGIRPGSHLGFARAMANMSWVADGVSEMEQEAISAMRDIATFDVKLANRLASFPWVVDGLDVWEAEALTRLPRFARREITLTNALLDRPWVADGVDYFDKKAIEDFVAVLARHRGLGVHVLELLDSKLDRRNQGVMHSFGYLARSKPDDMASLANQSWLTDGISPEEAAFLVTLRDIHDVSPDLYGDMINTRYSSSRTVVLPLSGRIHLWAFSNAPTLELDAVTGAMEDGARALEQVTRLPMPLDNIIFTVIHEPVGAGYNAPWGGTHTKRHNMVRTFDGRTVSPEYIHHELAHHQFNIHPTWLQEGGAQTVAAYVRDQKGIESMSERLSKTVQGLESACHRQGIYNLDQLVRRYPISIGHDTDSCHYVMGERFFLTLFLTLGEEITSLALRDYISLCCELGIGLTTKDMYQVFLQNTPAHRHSELRALFEEYFGIDLAGDGANATDDHGDNPDAGTPLAMGVNAQGHLDHAFDVDYFQLAAEGGTSYEVKLTHHGQSDFHMRVLPADGGPPQALGSLWGGDSGMFATWVPQQTGNHHLIVQSRSGSTGPYSLYVAPQVVGQDDHGDTAATASTVGFDTPHKGRLDSQSDLDFFRFQATESHWYRVEVRNENFVYVRAKLHDATGSLVTDNFSTSGGFWAGYQFQWMAVESGQYHAVVQSSQGNLGDYTIVIKETPIHPDDHGGAAAEATPLKFGQSVPGVIDHPFDRDFFSFRVIEGRTYAMGLEFGTLRPMQSSLLASDGTTPLQGLRSQEGPWLGSFTVPWVAPNSGEFFWLIQSYNGQTGTYTVLITADGN